MWLNHFRRIYPDTYEYMILALAMKVQHPEIKINHFQVWIGNQGIGKDTLLVPIRYAVGCWNFQEVSPSDIMDNFNPHVKSVILRISEARDEGEGARFDRFKFYDRMKTLTGRHTAANGLRQGRAVRSGTDQGGGSPFRTGAKN